MGNKVVEEETDNNKKLGLGLLVALGVGSMIGGGVFNSPTDLIRVANPQAIAIAWLVGGIGVIALALNFKMLAERRPDLTGGIYSYARAGFGDFMGFNSAWGYWVSGLIGNVAFFILMIKTLNDLLGPQHQLKPFVGFLVASVVLWLVVWIQTKGSGNVGVINMVVTTAKMVPLVLVIILGGVVFNPDLFSVPNWSSVLASVTEPQKASTSMGSQISGAMYIVLWCFIGVESSVVLAEKAKSQKIVGKATVIAILITLVVYFLIVTVSTGVIPAEELTNSATPLADVLAKTAIGSTGAIIVKVGILVSLLGALISWVMIAAQLPYVAAKEKIMPKFFAKENKNGVPTNSLYLTNAITQVFLLVLVSDGLQNVYGMVVALATCCILIPYLLSALYAYKVCKEDKLSAMSWIISIAGIIYALYCIYAVGIVYLAAAFILYAVGMFAFIKAKREKEQVNTKKEWIAIIVVLVIGIAMAVLLGTEVISL